MIKLNKYDIVIAAVLILISFTIITESVVGDIRYSPDAQVYLRCAESIKTGNGFYYNTSAGDNSAYCGIFSPANSILIALISIITSTDVYIASVVLSILIVIILILIIRVNYARSAWLISLTFLSASFLGIFIKAWSERIFLLGLLWLCIALINIIKEEKIKIIHYLSLCFAGILCFMTRYIGAMSVIAMAVCVIYFAAVYIKTKEKQYAKKAVGLASAMAGTAIAIVSYLLYNRSVTGYFTGGVRQSAVESFGEKAYYLSSSILDELKNMVSLWLKPEIAAALILTLVLALLLSYKSTAKYLKKSSLQNDTKSNTSSVVFAGTAFIYLCSIVYLRFSSAFDMFNARLMYPFTFLIMISVVIFISGGETMDKVDKILTKKACIIISIFLVITAVNMYGYEYVGLTQTQQTYYSDVKSELMEYYNDIPSNSIVVGTDGFHRNVKFIRCDVTIAEYDGYYNNIINDADRYEMYKNIYVDVLLLDKYLQSASDINEIRFYEQYLNQDKGFVKIK